MRNRVRHFGDRELHCPSEIYNYYTLVKVISSLKLLLTEDWGMQLGQAITTIELLVSTLKQIDDLSMYQVTYW